jgi:hypothetical protein
MEFTDEWNLQPVRRRVPKPLAGEILISGLRWGDPLQRSFGIPPAIMRTVSDGPTSCADARDMKT